MTRILYWNVNNFSLPKIQVPGPGPAANDAADRLAFMLNNVMGVAAGTVPDIIVIVEVYARVREVGAEGVVLNPNRNAGLGVLQLLADIRGHAVLGTATGTNWCVVPPLNLGELGQREAVAVFFNATTLQFTGPNLFYQLYAGPPGLPIGQSQPVNGATYALMMPYPAQWTAALPALGRVSHWVVGGHVTAIPENQLAGEWQYYAAGTARPVPSPLPPANPPNRLHFPNLRCRGPFHTQFQDVGTGRLVNIFSVHTSPATAHDALDALATVPEIATAPIGEVNVVLGDFNVDTFGGHAGYYNDLVVPPGGIYRMHLDPRPGYAGPVDPARRPYCLTHLLPPLQAAPLNNVGVPTDPQHNVYPRAGYMGSVWPVLSDNGAIDNVLTAYGPFSGGPAANVTVVNTLTGKPYTHRPAPAGVTAELTGGLPFPSVFPAGLNVLTDPGTNPAVGGFDPASPLAGAAALFFRTWPYFGKIYSTSDHLPLMIEV